MPSARTIRLTLFVAVALLLTMAGGLQWLRMGARSGEASLAWSPRATRPVSRHEPGYVFGESRDPFVILRQDLQTADFEVLIDLITTTIQPSSGWEEEMRGEAKPPDLADPEK